MIAYSVRESTRAKRVRLVMSPREGLVVVVPRGFDWARIPALLEDKSAWITRTAAEMERARPLPEPAEAGLLPETVCLRLVGEEWQVEYRAGAGRPGVVRAAEVAAGAAGLVATRGAEGAAAPKGAAALTVRLTGDVSDEAACRRALDRWLMRKAHGLLVPATRELAARHGFRVAGISIRRQKTRWGSCSRGGRLSLNANLLFLPPELVDYVLLHELCHTVHLDHSPHFWALLASFDPECLAKRKRLRTADAMVPAWLGME